jgi:hypothetical protein
MEGGADGALRPETRWDVTAHALLGPLQKLRDEAIVGSDEELPVDLREEHAPLGPHARVDDREMHGSCGKMGNGNGEDMAGVGDVLSRNVVGDVHEVQRRVGLENGPLHRAQVTVPRTKVRRDRDDP